MNIRMIPGRNNCTEEANCSTARSGLSFNCDREKQLARKEHPVYTRPGSQNASSSNQIEYCSLLRRHALSIAHQGDHLKAIALFSYLIEQTPDNASDFNNRGLLHFRIGNLEQALADYNQALQLNPRLAKVYNNRANCYASLGNLAEAIADYETAIDLDPANIHAWVNQAITFRELEMYTQALENFDLALGVSQMLQGSSEEAFNLTDGHIYAERGRTHHLAGDWNCAITDYQRALTNLPPMDLLKNHSSQRLHLQVEQWLDELLKPLLGNFLEEDAEL